MHVYKERKDRSAHTHGALEKEGMGMKSFYLVLNLLPSLVGDLGDVVLAEGASSIDEEPFVHAGTVEMVFAGEFPQLHPIIIGREADAALHIFC